MAGKLRIICLDVGQGDATVILGPTPGTAILVDAAQPDPVLEVLRQEQVHTITLALATHDDKDHIQGFGPVLRTFLEWGGMVQYVAVDQARLEATVGYKRFLSFLTELREGGTVLCSPTTDSIHLRDALTRTGIGRLLYPTPWDLQAARLTRRPNEGSAVLLIEWQGQRALLGADLEEPGWRRLIRDNQEDIGAQVFRFPHHGAAFPVPEPGTDTVSVRELLEAVAPSEVVISVGTNNPYHHPDPSVIHAIREYTSHDDGARLMCTQANYHCLDPDGEPFPTAAQDAVACAGTVIVEMGADGVMVTPAPAEHRRVFAKFRGPHRCR